MAQDLYVIEAPGKLRTCYKALEALGRHGKVVASMGKLYEQSKTLRDRHLDRFPVHAHVLTHLSEAIRACDGSLYLLTDNDVEGEVIAYDAARLAQSLAFTGPILRVKSPALEPSSLRRALDEARPWNPADADIGHARWITDRLIAVALSDLDRGITLGRIQAVMLSLVDAEAIPLADVTLTLPAVDRRSPFVAKVQLPSERAADELLQRWQGLKIPPAPVDPAKSVQHPLTPPPSHASLVSAMHDEMNLSLSDAATLLQELYEQGAISYPRSASSGYTQEGASAINQLGRMKQIVAFKQATLPVLAADSSATHSAIHITDPRRLAHLDLQQPIKLCKSNRDAALTLLARQNLESGALVGEESPMRFDWPDWTRGLNFQRIRVPPTLPWRPAPVREKRLLSPEHALIRSMATHGIGKPSTWVEHANRLSSRYLSPVRDLLALNTTGQLSLQQATSGLRDLPSNLRIESYYDRPDLTLSERIHGALMTALQDEETVMTLMTEAGLEIPAENAHLFNRSGR